MESVVTRAKERAVLAEREQLERADLEDAVDSFIDPLDPRLLRLQELAAILACSDKRFLPARYRDLDRAETSAEFEALRRVVR